jgi:hypothetical protein
VLEDAALSLLALFMTVFAFMEARQPHPWAAPETSQAQALPGHN